MTDPNGHVILIVDDDEDVREAVSLLLADEGFEVHGAPHGAAALEKLEQGVRPCAIILDLMMPVMNGWDFWDRHQASPSLRSIPVIILTATGLSQGSVGHARVLPKPVGAVDLLSAVHTACAC